VLNPEKIWHQQLVHLATSPVYCSHFTLGNTKSHFSTVLFIQIRIIYVISEENKLLPLYHTWKMSPHYLVKCKTFSSNWRFHHALLKFSQCRNKMLPQLVLIADWYSIHALSQYPNSAVPTSSSLSLEQKWTRIWANAQRDGRPAEYRWHPLFNAAKFGWRPLLECRAVTLPRRETRWNLLGCPKLANRSQPLLGRSSPYYEDMWKRYWCLIFFSDSRYMSSLRRYGPTKL